MLNETQAYLIFTRDPRFFNAGAIGMTQAEIDQLRAGFIANMPNFWLTPLASEPLPPVPLSMPACPPKQAMLTAGGTRLCLCYRQGGFACA